MSAMIAAVLLAYTSLPFESLSYTPPTLTPAFTHGKQYTIIFAILNAQPIVGPANFFAASLSNYENTVSKD